MKPDRFKTDDLFSLPSGDYSYMHYLAPYKVWVAKLENIWQFIPGGERGPGVGLWWAPVPEELLHLMPDDS
jgi:hypothetical protein